MNLVTQTQHQFNLLFKSSNIFFYTLLLFSSTTNSVFAQWDKLETQLSPLISFEHIECSDPLNCFAAGQEQIIKTNDGGFTWIDASQGINLTAAEVSTSQLICLDKNNCYLVGFDGLYRTINGGLSWELLPFSDFNYPQSLTFATAQISYAFGGSNTEILFKSIDNCSNWNQVAHDLPLDQYTNVYNMIFTNETEGHVVIHDVDPTVLHRLIYKTIDGGITWTKKFEDTLVSSFNKMQFLNDQVGYLSASPNGYLLKTVDGGETWKDISIPGYVTGIRGMDFLDEKNGYITGGSGSIYKTINGGESWTNESYSQAFPLLDVDVTSSDTVYVATSNNTILKNVNANLTAELFDQDEVQFGSIYPNPMQNKLTISLDEIRENMRFVLYDICGKEIANVALTENLTEWDRNQLQAGSYLFKILENNNSSVQLISTGKLIFE